MADQEGRPIGEDDLHALVDGCLDAARLQAVQHWLDANPEAAARVQAYAAQRDALKAALAPLAETPLPARLRVAHLRTLLRARRLHALRAMAAATALVLLGGGAGWLIRGQFAPEAAVLASPAELPAARAHRVFAANPGRAMELLTSDADQLAGWLARRLGAPVVVPRLDGGGFAVLGGRVLPAPDGAAMLVLYADRTGEALSFYAGPSSRQLARSMRCSDNLDGSLTYHWADGSRDYAVTATLPRERLRVVARLAQQEVERGPHSQDEEPRVAALSGQVQRVCVG